MNNNVREKGNSLEFESEVTMGSMPDKQLVYKIGMKDPRIKIGMKDRRIIFISGAVIPVSTASSTYTTFNL